MSIIRKFNSYISTLALENKSIKVQSQYQIQFYNCWGQRNEDMYWRQFIDHRHMLDAYPEKTVAVFSVFGRRAMIDKVKADCKIFYTAENLERTNFRQYSDHCLNDPEIDLSMGFEYIDAPKYIRFPLWMDYMFDAWFSEDDIRKKCAELRFPRCAAKDKICCMVASNPGDGLRKEMFDGISQVFHVDSAGRYVHNDDSLKNECGDSKIKYMSRYLFNICPENTNNLGYVTEKVFEAISCGCVPIYWGGGQNPEPDVLNSDAIIFWNKEDGGMSAIRQIQDLYEHPMILRDFMAQPRLKECAEEYVIDVYGRIESRLNSILRYSKG